MLEMQYDVDRILARRLLDPKEGIFEYLVAWKGFATDGDTWESQETLQVVQSSSDARRGLPRSVAALPELQGGLYRVAAAPN